MCSRTLLPADFTTWCYGSVPSACLRTDPSLMRGPSTFEGSRAVGLEPRLLVLISIAPPLPTAPDDRQRPQGPNGLHQTNCGRQAGRTRQRALGIPRSASLRQGLARIETRRPSGTDRLGGEPTGLLPPPERHRQQVRGQSFLVTVGPGIAAAPPGLSGPGPAVPCRP